MPAGGERPSCLIRGDGCLTKERSYVSVRMLGGESHNASGKWGRKGDWLDRGPELLGVYGVYKRVEGQRPHVSRMRLRKGPWVGLSPYATWKAVDKGWLGGETLYIWYGVEKGSLGGERPHATGKQWIKGGWVERPYIFGMGLRKGPWVGRDLMQLVSS